MIKQTMLEVIEKHKITVVHFSHHAVMSRKVEFPNDLIHAINNHLTETRSCCALVPNYAMDLPGSVGVIFQLEDIEQVLSVSSQDSGSSEHVGVEYSMGNAPSEINIRESLNVQPNKYNEWRISGAKPIGIFIADPLNILVKKEQKFRVDDKEFTDLALSSTTLAEIKAEFPTLPLFTMRLGGLERLL